MKLSQEDLEQNYNQEDPWRYKTCAADIERKNIILDHVFGIGPIETALDIGCGEGWITKDLPANKIFGYEASSQATARFAENVQRWKPELGLDDKFDLVMTTGTLYAPYAWQDIIAMLNRHASKYILTCNIASRELPEAISLIRGDLILLKEFDYPRPEDKYTQRLRIYKV